MSLVHGLPMEDVLHRVGAPEQFAWAEPSVMEDGPERGARRIRVANGSGLELELLPDRSLDIGRASAFGIPLGWHSGVGFRRDAAPGAGDDWLRTFGGGLIATCGLDNFGAAGDDGIPYGLHGGIGGQAARVTRREVTGAAVVVEGVVTQHRALGPRLALRRRIELPLGEPRVVLSDIITNSASESLPIMLLYHCNLGWPVVSDDTLVEIPSEAVEPRDEASEEGVRLWREWAAPTSGAVEHALHHRIAPGASARAVVTTPSAGLRVVVSWSAATLPSLFQWRLVRERDYVLGIEPANCATLGGRDVARRLGILPMLEAGETREYRVEIRVERLTDRSRRCVGGLGRYGHDSRRC